MKPIPKHPRKIFIYGVTGSGKTTLARKVSERLNIPFQVVDDLMFEADWKPVELEEQRRRVQEICSLDEWIIDAGYATWIEFPLATADLIVGLDYSRWLSWRRLFGRSIARAIDQKPICNGNKESFRLMFSNNSILLWHFRSFKKKSARIRVWSENAEVPPVLVCKTPKEAERWLRSLSR